jgi:hypothetical protein
MNGVNNNCEYRGGITITAFWDMNPCSFGAREIATNMTNLSLNNESVVK